MKHFGLTLAFTIKEDKSLIGVLRSYAVSCKDLEGLKKKAVTKGAEFIKHTKKNGQQSKYVGVADVSVITGPLKEATIFGQTFFEDLNTLTAAKKMVKKNSQFSFSVSPTRLDNYYYSSLVYFFKSAQTKQKFTFTIVTVVQSTSIE